MARPKKYKIKLTDDELKELKSVIRKNKTSKTIRCRCQIIIDLDESHGKVLTHEQSAKSNGVCLATVTNTVKKYFEGGIDAVTEFKRNVNSDNARRVLDGRAEARIIELACGPVPEGHSRWTIRLLEEKSKIVLNTPVSREAIRRALKKTNFDLTKTTTGASPQKNDAEFIACMEDVLDVYELPYNPEKPVVCMDEKPYQLLGDARKPLPMRPGDNQKTDSEYVRNGTCSIFAFVEPLGGTHHVSVREHRTAFDWAEEIKYLVDVMYPDAEKIILVMDNLNTHKTASLYKRYPADEARRIIKRLEIHYTPKHGSWLDIAEIGLNVMTRQCLSRRIENIAKLREELAAREVERNTVAAKVNWQFRTADARVKLSSLYPRFTTASE